MLGTGQSKSNTHTGQTTVRQGDMLIDGSLKVRGDISIDGNIIFNSQVIINPPACLNTDCINSVSGAGILVLDDLNLASSGNNILITDKINTINPATTGLRINNSYTLPVDASTANVGDILSLVTPHPLGTVAFTPAPTSTTARLIQNFFQMEEPRTTFNSTSYLPLYISGSGSDIINTADIAVGGSVRFRTKGYLYNGTGGGTTVLGQFELFIGINNTAAAFNYYSTNSLFIRDVGMGLDQTVGRGWWEVHVTVTKIDASNNCTVSVSGLWNAVESVGVNSETFDLQFYDDPSTFTNRLPNTGSSNTLVPLAYWSTLPNPSFKLSLGWKQVSGDARAIATEYTIDYLNTDQNVLVSSGGGGVSDHLLLTNLNGGPLLDGGHTNMFLTNGNKPMTGNIDMNNNNIQNVPVISNSGAPLVLFETSNANAIILNRDVNNGIYLECINPAQNINLSAGGGSNSFQVRPTDILAGSNLDMNNNDVINVSDLRGIGSNNHINMNPSNQMDISSGVIAINSSSALLSNANNYQVFRILNQDKILVTGSRIYIKNAPLDMDNNNIDNAAIISGPNGDLDFTGTETHLNSNNDLHLEAASNFNTEVRIQGSGEFKVLHGGGDRFSVENNIIRANRDFSMLNNDIGDVRSISMNNTLAEHPIIIYLPALVADFPNPIKNLLVKINSSGNIQPIAYGDPDSTGVIGTTDEIVVANGLVRVQVGGICSFTPSSGQTINAGQKFERSNSGTPVLFGTIIVANGVGTCGVALTSGTGAADGSVKILGLWTKNEHF